MRLKQIRLKTCYHRPAVPQKDNEGNSYVEYAQAVPFWAEEWPAGGKLQAEMYGVRLPNIRNLRIQGEYEEITAESGALVYSFQDGLQITVNDGICLHVPLDSKPDYKVVAIHPYRWLTLEVEKL